MNVSKIDIAGLEVVSCRAASRSGAPPLLFVHGAFAGAWCWEVHFLPWFAERGYDGHAVSLRGHGGSGGRAELDEFTIADYVDDVAAVVDGLGRRPLLIGHSMGGFVVQKYLEREAAAGAVLMASVPPRGLAGPGLSLAIWNPAAALSMGAVHTLGQDAGSPSAIQDALFSNAIAHGAAMSHLSRMGPESTRAVLDMYGGDLPNPSQAHPCPMLVMGAADDVLIPDAFVRATGRAFAAPHHILGGMGHLMMLDAYWEQAADCLLDWIRQNEV